MFTLALNMLTLVCLSKYVTYIICNSDGSEPKPGSDSARGSGFLEGSRLDFLGRAQARARLGLGVKSSSSLEELFIIIIYCTKVYFSGKINQFSD